MICDLVDYTLRTTPNKGRFSQTNTTASPNSSSNSSFEASQLKIPRPLLSFDEKFEASLCAFEFKLLVPEEDGLINFEQFSQELIQDKLIFLNDEKYLQQQQASLEIVEENILKDERTTLMLKNIPRSMKPNDLRNILNKEFRNLYDFSICLQITIMKAIWDMLLLILSIRMQYQSFIEHLIIKNGLIQRNKFANQNMQNCREEGFMNLQDDCASNSYFCVFFKF